MQSLKEILKTIGERHGVQQLNPMQRAVADARAGRLILLAPTGSGKTLAFTVPMVQRLSHDAAGVQAVIVAPTRELVIQIADVVRPVASGYKTVSLYGGHPMQDEINSMSPVPDIIVATPGRLLDHLLRGTADIATASQLVLDEYDKSLELGFHDQMRRIVRRTRRLKYVMLTSATPLSEMPDFLDLSQAKVLDFSAKAQAPRERMSISLVRSEDKDKLLSLLRLLRSLPDGKTMIFVNHRESAERVYDFLRSEEMPAGLYHGGLDQLRRQLAVDMLNNGTTPILVTTDLASRGLDVEAVRSVIHYHLPPSPQSWTHRNGRTARVDAAGYVYILASNYERLPEYVDYDSEYIPDDVNPDPIRSVTATIYINAGKKEKISRGDIVGFLAKQAGLSGGEIGKINLMDHQAIVAVPAARAADVTEAFASAKIKNQRVKATLYL